MADPHDSDRPFERPRSEPEIIPPGREPPRHVRREIDSAFLRFEERDGVQRIFIARPGWPSIVLAILIFGLIAAIVFVVLAGIVLIWIPLVVGAIVLALVAGALRYHWERLKIWWAGRS